MSLSASSRAFPVRVVQPSPALKIALGVLLVCYFAGPILVPLVVAILLALLLQPLVEGLDRRRVPHTLSALIAMLLATSIVAGVFASVYFQLSGASEQFGRWSIKLQQAYRYSVGLINWAPDDGRLHDPIAYLKPEFWTDVTVQALSHLTVLAATLLLIMIFVFFLLRDGRIMISRVLAASGAKWPMTQEILGKINVRIHQYIVTVFLIETALAMVLALCLWLLDVPYAFLWALLAGVLGLVPFIGATIAAIPPVLVTLAEFDGYGRALLVLSLYVCLQVVDGKFITPLLVGRRANLSPLVILLSTLFWGWLWGPIGLLLATPLLVCLKAVAESVPALNPMAVLIGGSEFPERPLAPQEVSRSADSDRGPVIP